PCAAPTGSWSSPTAGSWRRARTSTCWPTTGLTPTCTTVSWPRTTSPPPPARPSSVDGQGRARSRRRQTASVPTPTWTRTHQALAVAVADGLGAPVPADWATGGPPAVDWATFTSLAAAHGVAPLVRRSRWLGDQPVPSEVDARLHVLARRGASGNI